MSTAKAKKAAYYSVIEVEATLELTIAAMQKMSALYVKVKPIVNFLVKVTSLILL